MLLGLFVLFVAPILVAYALNVWWPNWSPFGRMNHGQIVESSWTFEVAALDQDAMHRADGRWILLHPAISGCDGDCKSILELTRRVHISLGQDHDRVVRALVYPDGLRVDGARPADAELILMTVSATWFDKFAGDIPVLLLVDPQRRAVLQYDRDLQGKGLARDLERVLKISKIG